MSNYEIWSLVIGGASLIATITVCIIASQLSKKIARNNIQFEVNKYLHELVNCMMSISVINNKYSDEKIPKDINIQKAEDALRITQIVLIIETFAKARSVLTKSQKNNLSKILVITKVFQKAPNAFILQKDLLNDFQNTVIAFNNPSILGIKMKERNCK